MNNSKKIKQIIFVLSLLLPINTAFALNAEECLDNWNAIKFNKKIPSLNSKMEEWKVFDKTCSAEGVYAYGVARLYASNNYLEGAQKVLKLLLKYKSKYYNEYLLLAANVEFNIVTSTDNFTNDDLNKVRNRYINIQQKYPNWYGGYVGLGNLELGVGNYKKSKYLLEKANKLQQSPLGYRGLTLIYNTERLYNKAIESGDIAYQLDDSLMSDIKFVLSLSNAYMHVGKNKVAYNLLRMLVSNNNDAMKDPDVLAFGNLLESRINKN